MSLFEVFDFFLPFGSKEIGGAWHSNPQNAKGGGASSLNCRYH